MGQSVITTVIGTGPQPPLSFAFWNVRADVVRDNLDRFVAETGEHIVCHAVSGDYGAWMDDGFSTGAAPTVFYAQRAEAAEWDARGFLAPLDETGGLAPSLIGMDSRMIAGARRADGRLIGLTYYNGGPFALFRHADVDIPGALESWDAVLEALRALRRNGMPHPFVPRWHATQTGLIWSLLCHLATEGVQSLDDPAAPQALTDALGFFERLWREDLVPPEALADQGDTDALHRWSTGQHALTFTMDYLAADAAHAAGRPISLPLPLPGKTGTALLPGHALLCLRTGLDPVVRQRAEAFLGFLGGRAKDGNPTVHRRWLSDCLFAVPYPELDNDPAIHHRIGRFFPTAQAGDCIARMVATRAAAQVSPPTHEPGFLAWSAMADAFIRTRLLRQRYFGSEAVADHLLQHWQNLRTSHL